MRMVCGRKGRDTGLFGALLCSLSGCSDTRDITIITDVLPGVPERPMQVGGPGEIPDPPETPVSQDAGGIAKAAPNCEPSSGSIPALQLTPIASGLEQPLYVAAAPGDMSRLFVIEQPGRIRIIENGELVSEPFLDVTERIVLFAGEDGLLGLAFHPDYARSGRFYGHYSTKEVGVTELAPPYDGGADGGKADSERDLDASTGALYIKSGAGVISEFYRTVADPNKADPNSERRVLILEQPWTNHNAGMLAFGPSDGLLYIATGDGDGNGDPNGTAQNLSTLLGKMLRIDVDQATDEQPYGIPAGNMIGQAVRPEVWSYGFRNPWRFSFDSCTSDLYVGDVGQNRIEEIDFEPPNNGGRNYGWNITEGRRCHGAQSCNESGITMPVLQYSHKPGCSVISGYVYRGHKVPALRGTYLYADFCSGNFSSFRMEAGVATDQRDLTADLNPTGIGFIDSFGVDNTGEVYAVSHSGVVYRIDPE